MSKISTTFTVTQLELEQMAFGDVPFDTYMQRKLNSYYRDIRERFYPIVQRAVLELQKEKPDARIYDTER